ncbi:MAG: hypothetical protein QXL94_07585 [Candidatus Parvarchaeum sp.]
MTNYEDYLYKKLTNLITKVDLDSRRSNAKCEIDTNTFCSYFIKKYKDIELVYDRTGKLHVDLTLNRL